MLERARMAGVRTMICVGSGANLASARAAVALAEQEPDIFATVGIHPHDAARMGDDDWKELNALAEAPKVVGIGETGLDFYYHHSPRDAQVTTFQRFIELGRRTRKPIVCHIRDAHDEATEILARESANEVGAVVHCFTGTREDARRYLDLGFYLSFSGIVTFKNAGEIREAARLTPLDRMLVETDAPFLAPVPHRGKRNEPAFVVNTLQTLAELKGLSPQEMVPILYENSRRLFQLPG